MNVRQSVPLAILIMGWIRALRHPRLAARRGKVDGVAASVALVSETEGRFRLGHQLLLTGHWLGRDQLGKRAARSSGTLAGAIGPWSPTPTIDSGLRPFEACPQLQHLAQAPSMPSRK
jgi:hypothetical protein